MKSTINIVFNIMIYCCTSTAASPVLKINYGSLTKITLIVFILHPSGPQSVLVLLTMVAAVFDFKDWGGKCLLNTGSKLAKKRD